MKQHKDEISVSGALKLDRSSRGFHWFVVHHPAIILGCLCVYLHESGKELKNENSPEIINDILSI